LAATSDSGKNGIHRAITFKELVHIEQQGETVTGTRHNVWRLSLNEKSSQCQYRLEAN
jgi:hypothetical protein